MPSTDTMKSGQPTVTRTVTKSVVPLGSSDLVLDPDVIFTKKHEEWKTSKRVVNHKTKQVETRVQRQLVLEDGRVVADSGPQVTTRTKEDVRVEESENTEHKTSGDDPPGPGYSLVPGSARVVSEKTESNQTVTETREENRQMHAENIKDLSGQEIHQRTIISPDDPSFGSHPLGMGGDLAGGKLTHFSAHSQKIVDKDEVKEVSELVDGEVTTETTRTHHHEEAYDDEVPEEEADPGMVPERSAESSRTLQYYTDPAEFEAAEERLQEESRRSRTSVHQGGAVTARRWVDGHFGGRTNGETSSGGNRITIQMSGHRSSPSDFSTLHKTDRSSRDSTLRNKTGGWHSPSPPYSPTSHPLHRSSPFEGVSSSSGGSSRSKTPVKTFYLGEDTTPYPSWKKKSSHSLADDFSLGGESNSLGRSNLSGHYGERSDSFYRVPKSKITENGVIYGKKSNRGVKTDKNVQVSMSDDDDDTENRKQKSTSTLPRTIRVTHETTKSPYNSNSLRNSKHYKSSDSLHSPGYGTYYHAPNNRNSSPIYNNTSFHRERNNESYKKSDWSSHNNYNSKKSHEVKVNKNLLKTSTPSWYSSLKSRKAPTSPPESGYQSPFPPTPPSSPPPRVIKVLHSDHYGSSSSISPPDSPSLRKRSTYPSGGHASRSKSSSDLHAEPLFTPQSFSPLSSPLKLKNAGGKRDQAQKVYRVKPGQDGQSVVVQVRDWSAR